METQGTAEAGGRAAAAPGRAGSIALWVVQALLAAGFAFSGGAKLAGTEEMVELFDTIGFGDWFRYLTGALEVLGAIGLLIPLLSGLAALGLAGVMVGAAVFDVFVLDAPPVAALVLLVLSLVVAWGRRGRTMEVLTRVRGGGAPEAHRNS
ncbi:DoxX family protein [Allosalinactinospora lopnorensis]|uniref:DoxX family protein n=1 Tax=Allosalinactinospora lopnorensis TaxID=1352348 RepID=UPI000623CB13|nr:DoxX family protein [Allosalinactinospora lopnorensis]